MLAARKDGKSADCLVEKKAYYLADWKVVLLDETQVGAMVVQ